MEITYLGHSCFKLRSSQATVVTDPFSGVVGLPLPRVSADVVTVSHEHDDHNNVAVVTGTARRSEPFVIRAPGEYEVMGISVFGLPTFHDKKQGAERGKNTMFVIHIDGMSVAHLGDLGHPLSEKQLEELDGVDVLLSPVGGVYTIDPAEAVGVINDISPAIVVPMHFRTSQHKQDVFGKLATVDDFLKEIGVSEATPKEKLSVTSATLPEETEVVVLTS